MRKAEGKRESLETKISASWCLDPLPENTGADVTTGVGFFDHMLTLLAKHSGTSLQLSVQGDLDVDCHHTVEDTGIVLGEILSRAAGDRAGIRRYSSCLLPMDESLIQVAIDFGGRPFFVFKAELPPVKLGTYDAEMTEEFFRALAFKSGMTLHINVLYGKNTHHIIEGIFKAFAHAMKEALEIDPRISGPLSTKGMLD